VSAGAPEPLLLDLLEWLAPHPRPYREVMDAWRTSCPRLPVWEDAVDRGLLARERAPDGGMQVAVTPRGLELLRAHGRAGEAAAAGGRAVPAC